MLFTNLCNLSELFSKRCLFYPHFLMEKPVWMFFLQAVFCVILTYVLLSRGWQSRSLLPLFRYIHERLHASWLTKPVEKTVQCVDWILGEPIYQVRIFSDYITLWIDCMNDSGRFVHFLPGFIHFSSIGAIKDFVLIADN